LGQDDLLVVLPVVFVLNSLQFVSFSLLILLADLPVVFVSVHPQQFAGFGSLSLYFLLDVICY
jgi:hypothetical protein